MLRVVNLSVGAHTLVASGRVDAVKIIITRRVKTLVDVHAFSAVTRLPETRWTSTMIVTVRAGSTVLSTLNSNKNAMVSYKIIQLKNPIDTLSTIQRELHEFHIYSLSSVICLRPFTASIPLTILRILLIKTHFGARPSNFDVFLAANGSYTIGHLKKLRMWIIMRIKCWCNARRIFAFNKCIFLCTHNSNT